MINFGENSLTEDFWETHLSLSISKNDIEPDAWDRIRKIRNTPIRLVQKVIYGTKGKPHIVFPIGSKGYIVDYPEVFNMNECNRERFAYCEFHDCIPAMLCGFSYVIDLHDDEYEIIQPFFDQEIANFAALNRIDYE